jgi:surfeit locus 1 family protein
MDNNIKYINRKKKTVFFFQPHLWASVCLIIAFPILIFLGLWQLDRQVWKDDLISQLKSRVEKEETQLPITSLRLAGNVDAMLGKQSTNNLLEDFNFSPIYTMGEFLEKPIFFKASYDEKNGNGYDILALLKDDNGYLIPVDMGYVPKGLVEDTYYYLPKGKHTVKGILRLPELEYSEQMVADKGVMGGGWSFKPYLENAEIKNLVLPIYLKSYTYLGKKSDNLRFPQPHEKDITVNIANNHTLYAYTWFAFAIILIIVYLAWHYADHRLYYGDKF